MSRLICPPPNAFSLFPFSMKNSNDPDQILSWDGSDQFLSMFHCHLDWSQSYSVIARPRSIPFHFQSIFAYSSTLGCFRHVSFHFQLEFKWKSIRACHSLPQTTILSFFIGNYNTNQQIDQRRSFPTSFNFQLKVEQISISFCHRLTQTNLLSFSIESWTEINQILSWPVPHRFPFIWNWK